jgi:hypothetical protein
MMCVELSGSMIFRMNAVSWSLIVVVMSWSWSLIVVVTGLSLCGGKFSINIIELSLLSQFFFFSFLFFLCLSLALFLAYSKPTNVDQSAWDFMRKTHSLAYSKPIDVDRSAWDFMRKTQEDISVKGP